MDKKWNYNHILNFMTKNEKENVDYWNYMYIIKTNISNIMEFFIKMIMITNNSTNNQVKIYLIRFF